MLNRNFLIIIIFLIHIFFSLFYYEPYTFLHEDGIAFAFISISISEDGDLFMENNLPFFAIGDRPEKSFYSLGKNGKFYPKHSPFMSFLAVPFYKLFGFNGFLIFNLISFFCVLFFLSRFLQERVSFLQALAFSSIFLLPFIFYHTYSFCPDILLTTLISASFFFLNKGNLVSGILSGLCVFLRPNYAFQVFPSLFISKNKIKFLAGFLIGLIPFFLYNTIIYGSPFLTSYDKTVVLTKMGKIYVSHYELFSLDFSRFFKILALYPRGLLFSAPVIFPLLFSLFLNLKKYKDVSIFLFSTWLWHYIFYGFYIAWLSNHIGLRFFLVPVLLTSLASLSLQIEKK